MKQDLKRLLQVASGILAIAFSNVSRCGETGGGCVGRCGQTGTGRTLTDRRRAAGVVNSDGSNRLIDTGGGEENDG